MDKEEREKIKMKQWRQLKRDTGCLPLVCFVGVLIVSIILAVF